MKPEHSIKVPRLYKVASSVLKSYQSGQGSVKTLVFEARKKHPNVKALFALVNESLKHEQNIKSAFEKLQIMETEKPLDFTLALILTVELVFGKKALPGQSKPILTIQKYEDKLKELIDENPEEPEEIKHPRYVRINLLKTTKDLILLHLHKTGFKFQSTPKNYDDFLALAQALEEKQFMCDFHMPEYLLVFHPKTSFFESKLYSNGSLILQDKASCLSVASLAPLENSVILDACSAPGMKTSHAAMSKPQKLIAIERNRKRFKILNQMMKKHCDKSSKTQLNFKNQDFLKLKHEEFQDVEYIIADPTCSGSGTKNVKITDLAKLSNLQCMILKHALKFPAVKKVVYSTCSINVEENENVVQEVLKEMPDFQLVKALESWQRRGLNGLDKCIRVDPEIDLCTGFFVAVFERK